MSPQHLIAVDIHAHFGWFDRPEQPELNRRMSSADAATVAERARRCGIGLTVVSPLSALLPRGQADVEKGNSEAVKIVPKTPGLLQWVVVNPLQPGTFDQAREVLAMPQCVGIKIHPDEHCYSIQEYGDTIFSFAESQGSVVLTHSGDNNSMPRDFISFADRFPEVVVILAHIGCGPNHDRTLQVRAIQGSTSSNVFADTSSATSIRPGLIEWAVQEIGADRILFGTDSPLYCTCMQRERINGAELDDSSKRMILRDNAIRVLDLDVELLPFVNGST